MATIRRRKPPFPECKVLGHAWDDEHAAPDDGSLNGWDSRLDLFCVRCHTYRTDWLDYLGEVGARRYRYPDGYQAARGEERPSRAALRLMLVKR